MGKSSGPGGAAITAAPARACCGGLPGSRHRDGCPEAGKRVSGARQSTAQRKDRGGVRVEVWLSAEEAEHLDSVAPIYGGRTAAIRAALASLHK